MSHWAVHNKTGDVVHGECSKPLQHNALENVRGACSSVQVPNDFELEGQCYTNTELYKLKDIDKSRFTPEKPKTVLPKYRLTVWHVRGEFTIVRREPDSCLTKCQTTGELFCEEGYCMSDNNVQLSDENVQFRLTDCLMRGKFFSATLGPVSGTAQLSFCCHYIIDLITTRCYFTLDPYLQFTYQHLPFCMQVY